MSSFATLLRLRQRAREESQALVRRAEDEREAQAQRLAAVRDSVVRAREELDHTNPIALTNYHAFRMRQEVAERREAGKLVQRERELEQKRAIHVGRVRDELAMQNVIEAHAREEAEAEARRDARRMDEIAARLERVEA